MLHDGIKMMITKTVLSWLNWKKCLLKNFTMKNFKQKLRHQVVEAEAEPEALRVEAEAIQKFPLPHP